MNEGRYKIGFVGIGKMGLPICLRLAEAGHDVTILSSPRAQGLVAPELSALGCKVVLKGAELGSNVDVLITCLPSSAEVDLVVTGDRGIFSGLSGKADLLHIDHTSGDPNVSRKLAAEWERRGAKFIDAAVSGTPELARGGTLKLLCGGSPEVLERMETASRAYATEVVHAGGVGNGHMLRLIGGLMGYGMAMLSSEAFLLCGAAGIAPDKLKAMITGSGADSRTFQAMAAAEIEGPDTAARRKLSIATVAKDLDALLVQAAGIDCTVPVVARIRDRLSEVADRCGPDVVITDLTQCLKATPGAIA